MTDAANTRSVRHYDFVVTVHDTEYTHAMFGDGGIICSIEDVFKVIDSMHTFPTKLLKAGWMESATEVQPKYSKAWIKVDRNTCWVTSHRGYNEMGHATAIKVGPGAIVPTTIVTREFVA